MIAVGASIGAISSTTELAEERGDIRGVFPLVLYEPAEDLAEGPKLTRPPRRDELVSLEHPCSGSSSSFSVGKRAEEFNMEWAASDGRS